MSIWMAGAAVAIATSCVAGAVAAWWMHRRTGLSPWNAYLAWAASVPLAALAGASRVPALFAGALAVLVGATVAAVLARRWRQAALGAGGELREFERARVMAWRRLSRERRSRGGRGERVLIASQGELVRQRAWPERVPALPMTGDGRGLIPLGEGHHLFLVGATGSGKTTSARRWLLARGLTDPATALLVLDPKEDPALEQDLRAVAAATGRPFVLFDPYEEGCDRWNPVWAGDPGAVVARLMAPVEANADSDASHYSRVLRVHLGLVAEALKSAGRWPVALPVLLRAAQRPRFAKIATLARGHGADDELLVRLLDHAQALEERTTQGQLDGSLRALEVVSGQAWRRVLTPLPDRGAVTLPAAMAAGAVVLWKTHVEDVKEEAETITTLALADIGAAARTLASGSQWALLIDEFGAVLQGRAGERAVALMQRARSSGGQLAVCTQSVSDVPSATGDRHLLGSLTDNFTGFVLHRQTAPESRDWLAKLLGTREIWQFTDRTLGGGTRVEGTGSRRRAAEFIVRPDDFRQLRTGEAVVWSTLGPPPDAVTVTPGPTPDTLTNTATRARQPSSGAVYRTIATGTLEDLLGGEEPDAGDTRPQRRTRRSSTARAENATPGAAAKRPAARRAPRAEHDDAAKRETAPPALDASSADAPAVAAQEEASPRERAIDPGTGRRATPSDGPDALWNGSR